jgi:ElaB/YqjD/DUF883 family membrane-anchored ribosome-binding protein
MANYTSTKDSGHSTADKMKEAAGHAVEKTKEVAANVGQAVSNAASATVDAAGKTADKMASATGSGVKHLGETIKEKGPQEGVLAGATQAVGNTLEKGGKYLEEEGISGMMDDVTELIRRNPVPAVLVGIGIGFLIGRTLGS